MEDVGKENKLPTPQNSETMDRGADAGKGRQYYTTFTVCIVSFISGANQGWPTPMLVLLKSADSPVGKMSLTQMSYLESLPSITALVSMLFFGGIVDKVGRKITGYIAVVPCIVGSFFLASATSPYHLYIGRILVGFSVTGLMLGGQSILAEATHSSRRGTMISFFLVVGYVASLIVLILGGYLSYRAFNISYIVAPVLFPIFFYFLPESPYFLVSKSKTAEAQKSLLWYRGGQEAVVAEEMKAVMNVSHQDVKLSQLLKSKSTRRALMIITFMYSFQQLGGSSVIAGYASLIFEGVGGSLSPITCSIILIGIKLASTYGCTLIIDKVKRRILMMVSFAVMSFCLIVTSVFFYINDNSSLPSTYKFIPLVTLCIYFTAFGMGVGTLPGVIGSEIVSPDIRGIMSMISGSVTILLMSLSLQAYPFIEQYIGMYANFAIPAVANFIGCFLAYKIIPETRGMLLADILEQLER